MARRKNTKRIDPRYFLNETVNRNDEVVAEEEIEEGLDEMSMIQRLAQAKRLADRDGGSSSDSDDAIYNAFGGSKARMAQDRYDKRKRADAASRRQKVKDDIEMDKWKNRDRTHSQEHGEIEEGKKEEIQALIDAGMISPEEAKNMLAGRSHDDSGKPSGRGDIGPDLGTDEVDSPGKPSALKRKVAALAKKLGICEETMVEEIRKALEE